jgi:hypothetical protein
VSLTPAANLLPLSLTPTTPEVPEAKFAAGVIDTVGKFTNGVVYTGVKFAASIIDTVCKFDTGVVDTGNAPSLANISTNFQQNLK